jgi:hypothetical protein
MPHPFHPSDLNTLIIFDEVYQLGDILLCSFLEAPIALLLGQNVILSTLFPTLSNYAGFEVLSGE